MATTDTELVNLPTVVPDKQKAGDSEALAHTVENTLREAHDCAAIVLLTGNSSQAAAAKNLLTQLPDVVLVQRVKDFGKSDATIEAKKTPDEKRNIEELLDERITSTEGYQQLVKIYPEIAQLPYSYQYGVDEDINTPVYDPIAKQTVVVLDIEAMEDEMKYMVRDDENALEVRAMVSASIKELASDPSLEVGLAEGLREIAQKLQLPLPEYDAEGFDEAEFFCFYSTSTLLDKFISKEDKQVMLRKIYAAPLANCHYSIDFLLDKTGSAVLHELTHAANDAVMPETFFGEEAFTYLEEAKREYLESFFTKTFGNSSFNFMASFDDMFPIDAQVLKNQELAGTIIAALGAHGYSEKDCKEAMERAARDEVIAFTMEERLSGESFVFTPGIFWNYASWGKYRFLEDPNTSMQKLNKKLDTTADEREKRDVLIRYLQSGEI